MSCPIKNPSPRDFSLMTLLWLYQKIWDWDWIFGRAVKAISSLGIRSLCLLPKNLTKVTCVITPLRQNQVGIAKKNEDKNANLLLLSVSKDLSSSNRKLHLAKKAWYVAKGNLSPFRTWILILMGIKRAKSFAYMTKPYYCSS